MTLPISWTSHLSNDPEAKASLEITIRASTTVIHRLRDILEEKEKAYNSSLYSLSTPKEIKLSLIDRIGELRDLKKLLTFE